MYQEYIVLQLTNCRRTTFYQYIFTINFSIMHKLTFTIFFTLLAGSLLAQSPARQSVETFFTSLENMNIDEFMTVWAEDPVQVMPYAPSGFPDTLQGAEAIRKQYAGLKENYNSMRYERTYLAENDSLIVVKFRGIIPKKDGGNYNNDYIGVYHLEGDKIKQYTEYFDPIILQEDMLGRTVTVEESTSSNE